MELFLELIEPWRSAGNALLESKGTSMDYVCLQVDNASENILGIGKLVVCERGVYWEGSFKFCDLVDESSRVNETADWKGEFGYADIVNLEYDDENGKYVGATLVKEKKQKISLGVGFKSEQDAEQFLSAVTDFEEIRQNQSLSATSQQSQQSKKDKKSKKSSRRTSISLQPIGGLFDSPPRKAPESPQALQGSDKPVKIETNNGDESDLYNLVRAFVKSPERLGRSTQEQLFDEYSYPLSLLKTPSKDEVMRSPPRSTKIKPSPELIEKLKLREIFKSMEKNGEEYMESLRKSTKTKFVESGPSSERPAHSRSLRYICVETSKEIHPQEYKQRYNESVLMKKNPILNDVAPEISELSGTSSSDTQLSNHSTVQVPSEETPFDFEKELLAAEACMHREFDLAIEKFLEKRIQLEKIRDSLQKNVHNGESETSIESPERCEKSKTQILEDSGKRRKKANRRKSVSLDSLSEILGPAALLADVDIESMNSGVQPSEVFDSKKVIWSMKTTQA